MRRGSCALALLTFAVTYLVFVPGTTLERLTTSTEPLKRKAPPPVSSPSPGSFGPKEPSLPLCDVEILPLGNAQGSIDASPERTSFCFAPGVHRVSNLQPKDGHQFFGQLGAVLSGGDSAKFAFNSTADGVTIAGLVIEHFDSPLQQGALQIAGPGWTVRDNEIRNNAALGIKIDARGSVLRNHIHHNGQLGVGSFESTGVLVEGNEIAFNNTRDIDMDFEAGGGKFVRTTNLTVRNNYIHDNKGPGLWTDADNYKAIIEGNRIIDNAHTGIFHEISYHALIRNNVVAGNAPRWRNGLWRGGIVIANSSNVQVYGNTLSGNGNGITVTEQDRGSGKRGPWIVRNLSIHRNSISMSRGQTGVDELGRDAVYASTRRIRFSRNTYYLRTADCRCFRWRGSDLTRSRWVATGHDRASRFYVR